ncbi:hypothetical protein [Hymenobacter cheonanensis]|uniref:hypothetical protein n=1 Tax=Hymenobacter sp. CA2-7 TaxID=3063993 RepID=UPI00271434AE|nr:hypothetical protein [Hymenobacter sp. CA2-7]MDO7884266.1 hypothetical protein [Hymenobacter sp. CA2-7]
MWYKQQRKRVRQARKMVKHQQEQLLILELEGIVAVQLHTLTSMLSLSVPRDVASQLADVLREALRERRAQLKKEAAQLTNDQRESQELRATDKALLKAAKNNLPR